MFEIEIHIRWHLNASHTHDDMTLNFIHGIQWKIDSDMLGLFRSVAVPVMPIERECKRTFNYSHGLRWQSMYARNNKNEKYKPKTSNEFEY